RAPVVNDLNTPRGRRTRRNRDTPRDNKHLDCVQEQVAPGKSRIRQGSGLRGDVFRALHYSWGARPIRRKNEAQGYHTPEEHEATRGTSLSPVRPSKSIQIRTAAADMTAGTQFMLGQAISVCGT
ncbi:MAG: hypothetical protein H6Q06_1541, partial [Acidobacteria bacterium]|nr:hypothetical protein [Acidobacteriota bacterium]